MAHELLVARLNSHAATLRREPVAAAQVGLAADLLTEAATVLEPIGRAETRAEGYDSPAETHRRTVRLYEYVTGLLEDPDIGALDLGAELEGIQERLANIIKDMPANRTREASRG
jgi:hypothetical protein